MTQEGKHGRASYRTASFKRVSYERESQNPMKGIPPEDIPPEDISQVVDPWEVSLLEVLILPCRMVSLMTCLGK